MKHAMVVNIQNHGLRSMLICLGSGLISTRIAIAATIFVIINRVVSVSRLNSRMKQKPASPKHVSKPNAGLNNNCLFQSPSLSMRLASARPGRIATSKPRDITSPRPSSLQTYLRRMMNQGRLEVTWLRSLSYPMSIGCLISQGVKIQISNALSPIKSGDMMRFDLECTLTNCLAASEIYTSE